MLIMMGSFKWKDWIMKMDYGSLVCCSIAFLLYYNTLNSEFVYDDRRAILTNPDLLPKTPWHRLLENDFWGTPITDSSSHGSYRPLSVLSFRLNYLMSEYNPWGYHFVNVVLHCLATYLLMKIASNVLPKSRGRLGPFVTGALFATHPIHTEAVASVVGRADLLACNFFFLSLLAYTAHVRHRNSTCCSKTCDHRATASKSNQKRYERIATTLQKSVTSCNWPKNKGTLHRDDRASSRNRVNSDNDSKKSGGLPSKFCCWVTFIKIWWYIFLCVVLAVCAMLSKETGITVLGVSFVYDFVYSKTQKKKQKKSLLVLSIALLLILAARLQTKSPQFSTADNPTAREPSSSTRLMTFSYLPALNFWMLLYPGSLSFDWGMDAIPKIQSIRDPRVFFTLCFYGILTATVGVCIFGILERRYRWFEDQKLYIKAGCDVCHRRNSDSHSHNCRIANNNNTTHNHPFLCVCPASGKKSHSNPSIKEALIFSIALIVLPFLPASNLFFYVGFVVAERVLYLPSAGFCLLMGIVSVNLWKNDKIQKYFCAGLVLVLIGHSAKTILRNRDWFDEEALYRSAIPYNPPKAYGNLGSILNAKGRVEEAEALFRMALEHRPNMADVHYNLKCPENILRSKPSSLCSTFWIILKGRGTIRDPEALLAVQERVCAALKISRKTVYSIRKKKENNPGLSSPTKKRSRIKPKTTDLSESTKMDVRNTLYDMYKDRKHVTITTLNNQLRTKEILSVGATSLSILLKELGFKYKKDDNRRALIERSNIASLRARFLKENTLTSLMQTTRTNILALG